LTDEFEEPEEKKRSGKPKKRDTIKSLFGAKAAAKKEETPVAEEEAPAAEEAEVEETAEATEESAE
jgi:hypothetical protein